MEAVAHAFPHDNGPSGLTTDLAALKQRLTDYMVHVVGKDPEFANERDWFYALTYLLRGILGERLLATSRAQHQEDARRVYYLSIEYLIGRRLRRTLNDLGILNGIRQVFSEIGVDLAAVESCEFDSALGNGGYSPRIGIPGDASPSTRSNHAL